MIDFNHIGIKDGLLYLEVHTALDEHGMPSTLDKQAAIQRLLAEQQDKVQGFRLDWKAIRDLVYAESGIPGVIGQPIRTM